MAKKSPAKSAELRLTSVPAFRPVAMAATMREEGTELAVKNGKIVEEEIKINETLRPKLEARNRVRRAARGCITMMDSGRTGSRSRSERPCGAVGRVGSCRGTQGDVHVSRS